MCSTMQEINIEEPYPCESEHAALKGNPDYHKMLSTIAMLEAQRSAAVKHIDVLLNCKDAALKSPIAFVHKLQHSVDLGIPSRQVVAELPNIDWDRYSHLADTCNPVHRHSTRQQKQQGSSEHNSAPNSGCNTPVPPVLAVDEDDTNKAVRGRRGTDCKPATFNKLWTLEEQHRLEELLVKYPPEEVEAKRWQKIADELGNRTRQQVQSRVQKYFIRLAREGMPVPGRIPHNLHHYKRRVNAHHKNMRLLYPSSTFCASYKPPVYMSDDESSTGANTPDMSFTQMPMASYPVTVSDEEDIPDELRDCQEYTEILRIKKLKKQEHGQSHPKYHMGYKCDRCGVEPIMGARWHCHDCPHDISTDLCDNCSEFEYESVEHRPWHTLTPIHTDTQQSHLDIDYQHSQFIKGDYNYLDPNFIPAT